ncbi:DUF4157 domain-containing protein [Tateyamaria sp. syn59]|uniref:eCIS core domain-containing protein n=1 Tax=Tateyamaria sp. syn59 TaxID=2576942 RepID=UPI0011BEBC3E|nr:DUF4157 domain-containing protein [Tateyamaria sp. syn59]
MKTAARIQSQTETGRASGRPQGPFFSGPAVQAKLNVSRPGDKHERQADQAADAVVHGRGPLSRGGPIASRMTPVVQRAMEDDTAQAMHDRASDPQYEEHEPVQRPDYPTVEDEPIQMAEEETAQTAPEEAQMAEEEVQTAPEDAQMAEDEVQTAPEEAQMAEDDAQMAPEDEQVQARAQGAPPSARAIQMARVERQLRAARGRGNPLPEPTRRKMEAGLGADLSGVRIHTDTPAALMTKLLNAKAFASGRDIFFSPTRFSPGTQRGDHLIAHEVAHTLQQGAIELSDNAPAQRAPEGDTVASRPESLRAIGYARQHIGKINTKLTDEDGNRQGWERLLEIFRGAFDGDVISPAVIQKPIMKDPGGLPHWCGIFAWSMLRKAGIPLPPWQLGKSILPHVEPRPPNKLPEKGDIAYRQKWPGLDKFTHHQALVTGVESVETAAGKPFDAVMIRTVDGNTAGNDNLGGQVEEKWLPARLWDHFFDPTAKVDLPDVPLIETDRASDDLGGLGPEDVPQTDSADPTPEAELTPDEADAAPPPLPGDVLQPSTEEVGVDLPPAPDASVEPPAKIEKLTLEGSSDQAMTSFLDAGPSQMAMTAPTVGSTLNAKADGEKADAADNPPVLKAQTGGELNPELTAPSDIPTPADTTLAADGTGPENGDLTPDPYEEKGTAPSTKTMRDKVKKQPEGGFLDWLRNQFANIMASIRTSDDSINTGAGARKRVALTGNADLGQMGRQRSEGTEKLRGERDKQTAAFRNHPGQSNIQPRKVDETRTATVSREPTEPVTDIPPDDGAAEYVGAELPQNVRDAADAKIAPDLHANLADARAETVAAASKRDADRDASEAEAESRAEKANTDADDLQRQAVVAGRTDVARKQGEAIGQAYDGVAKFATDAGQRETDDTKKIRDDVKTEEGKADKELDKGEGKARQHKKDEEAKAAAKKKELKEKKEKQGLLDRAASFVKDVVSKITEAIDAIFDGLRKLVKAAIDAAKDLAIGIINAARAAAITALEGFRTFAKGLIDTTVGTFFPDVAKSMNEGIDGVVDTAVDGVNAAADGAIAGVEAAADWLGKKLNEILDKFKAALKGAVRMAGALMTGDFAGAARIAVETACEIAGIDPQPIFDFMDRAKSQVAAILKAPGKFINNVMTAVGMGVRGFAERFGQHFKTGAIQWLTGALSTVPITLPDKWDIKGIFSLVAQILGITYDNIKSRVIKKFPKAAKIFDLVEAGFALVKKLIDKDFSGLWEEVKAKLANLKQTVIDGIKGWAITNVIKEGIIWLLSLLNPASALVKALKLLADLVFWLIDNFERIKTFVLSVYSAISNIAAGVLGPAAKAVEDAMARSLPVVISFVASAIGLGNIGEAVQGVIAKITAPINKMIDALIDRIVAFAKKLWGKTKEGAKKVKDKILKWWKAKRPFTSKDGGSHELYYKGSGAGADLWIASKPSPVKKFLNKKIKEADDAGDKALFKKALKQYGTVLKHEAALQKLITKNAKKSQINAEEAKFRSALDTVRDTLRQTNLGSAAEEQTQVKFTDGSTKSAYALPLTRLEGNTKGSAPKSSAVSPEWTHATLIDTDAKGKRMNLWVRGHLLNDNLHGPGENKNLVPITQKMNSKMRTGVEAQAKSQQAKSEDPMFYKADATFWSAAAPVNRFPKSITVKWGLSEKNGKNFRQKKTLGQDTITMPEKPPLTATAKAPSIAEGSTSQILAGISGHGGVTTHFVTTHLIAKSPFSSRANMRSRLYTKVKAELIAHGGDDHANTRKRYVDNTYNALKAGDIRL